MADSEYIKLMKELNKLNQELEKETIEHSHEYYVKLRTKELEAQYKKEEKYAKNRQALEKKINEQLEKDKNDLIEYNKKRSREEDHKKLIEDAENRIKHAATVQEQKDAERQKLRLEQEEQIANQTGKAIKAALDGYNGLYDKITESAKWYGNLVGSMETRLLGSGKTYSSVADMLSRTFAISPFFSMQKVMEKTNDFIKEGIAYNVELRASMQVVSEKIATTFNAMDATLTRLVRIQQSDSTQARLGMENALTKFFNNQYKDTSYLNSTSANVRAYLLEAQSQMDKKNSTEFEYTVQKWLGSLYSVGASENLINKLAEGIGYLGSGNLTSLTGDTALTSLLVSAANRGGGKSYGEIATEGITNYDVSDIMVGLYDLVKEISDTDNIVALKEYASVFGLTVSDLTSILNLSVDDLKLISEDMLTYDNMLTNLQNELKFSKLYQRSSGAEIADNLLQNLIDNAGKGIGGSPIGYFAWQMAGMVNEFLSGIETGVDIQPFGIGTHLNLSIGDLTKAATVTAGLASGLGSILTGIGSIGGIALRNLENAEVVERGSGVSIISEGTKQSQTKYVGDTSESAILDTANAQADDTASKVMDQNVDEEQEKMKKMQSDMSDINDNVAFIVQLLNSSGIVIRGRANETSEAVFSGLAANGGGFISL